MVLLRGKGLGPPVDLVLEYLRRALFAEGLDYRRRCPGKIAQLLLRDLAHVAEHTVHLPLPGGQPAVKARNGTHHLGDGVLYPVHGKVYPAYNAPGL